MQKTCLNYYLQITQNNSAMKTEGNKFYKLQQKNFISAIHYNQSIIFIKQQGWISVVSYTLQKNFKSCG